MFLFALRNLFLQRKRYALMALAVAVGFMLITVLTGLSYGALETIKTKAARYFSGHIIVYGFENTGMSIPDPESYAKIINKSRLPLRTVSPRSVYYGKETSEEDAEALGEKIRDQFGDCEVEVAPGGQPIYYYIMSVE